ncbi:Ig-like domain-containing protein [Vibrio diabolicus]
MYTIKRFYLSLPLCFGLMACGGDDTSPLPPPSEQPQAIELSVSKGAVAVQPNTQSAIELSHYVSVTEGASVELNDVTLLTDSDACSSPETTNSDFSLSFNAQVDGYSLCRYEYSVNAIVNNSIEKTKSSVVSVMGSTSSNPVLTPIPYAIELNNSSVTVNIKIDDELANVGDNYPTGYVLSDEYTLLGDGFVTVDSDLRTINYTAVSKGPHQIIYQLKDPNGADHRFGIIDIAVSDGLNQGPVADKRAIYPDKVEARQTLDIDISPFVSSPDGDDFQLQHVNSFDANVAVKDPLNASNKVFTFNAAVAGDYYVSFTIVDHKGGMDIGLMKVVVYDPEQNAKWAQISYSLNVYIAPLTYAEAEQQGENLESVGWHYDSAYSPSIKMPLPNFTDAASFCAKQGRLATSDELVELHANESPSDKHNWPVRFPYWASDNGTPILVDLKTGAELSPSPRGGYTTCVQDGNLSLNPIKVSAIADGVDKVEVEATLTIDGKPQEGLTLSADITGNAVLDDKNVVTDADGKALFAATNSLAEEVTLSIDTLSLTVEFIGDESTAEISSLDITKNLAQANINETNANKVAVTLLDVNGNPVSGALINFSTNSPHDRVKLIEPADLLVTNKDGIVEASFANAFSEKAEILADYTNSSGTSSSANDFVEYTPIVELDDLMWHRPLSVDEANSLGFSSSDYYTMYDVDYIAFNFSDALNFCSQVALNGFNDWRLPSIEQLNSLYDQAPLTGTRHSYGWITGRAYWSDTQVPNSSLIYMKGMGDGEIFESSRNSFRMTSCVRDND